MELSIDYFPDEILRRMEVFFSHFKFDFDLRYPDARMRHTIELEHGLTPEFAVQAKSLIKEWRETPTRLSVFEWSQLSEWNERIGQMTVASAIQKALFTSWTGGSPRLRKEILDRLSEIRDVLLSQALPENPSVWHLLKFRWTCAALRHEARYLLDRLSS